MSSGFHLNIYTSPSCSQCFDRYILRSSLDGFCWNVVSRTLDEDSNPSRVNDKNSLCFNQDNTISPLNGKPIKLIQLMLTMMIAEMKTCVLIEYVYINVFVYLLEI